MYGMLIVDDEKGIREGLKQLLDWEDYGIEIVGEASNGQEAVDLVRARKPSLAIVDIQMPVMNGLELVKWIHAENAPVKVIVLSGYDQFEYVREAMKFGAANYLLKPVDKQELAASVKEISEGLSRRAYSDRNNRESLQLLRDSLLNRIVRNEINVKELNEKSEFLGLDFRFEVLYAAAIELDIRGDRGLPDETRQWQLYAARNICEEMLSPRNALVFTDSFGHIAVLFRGSASEIGRAEIERALAECMDGIVNIVKVACFAAVGSKASSLRELAVSYRQSLLGLDYRLVLGLNRVAFHEDSIERSGDVAPSLELRRDAIKEWTRALDKEALYRYFDRLFAEGEDATPRYVRDTSMEIVLVLLQTARELQVDEIGMADIDDFSRKLRSLTDKDGLIREIRNLADRIVSSLELRANRKYSKTVREAMDRVIENYSNADLSLKTLAHELNLNAAYLGRTFKEETGELFSDFLCKLRVEKAKELLADPELRVGDVSAKVGFANTNYFYTVFKKFTGSNPSEYRTL